MDITSIEILKRSATKTSPTTYDVVLNLKGVNITGFGEDEVTTVLFNEKFTEIYMKGSDLSALAVLFKDQMQEYINEYKAKQSLLDNTKMNQIVSYLGNNLSI